MVDRLSAYRAALEYLFVRTTGQWRFGLERTRALLEELGNPHHALNVIHVGGTNGKGSVCATIDTVLRARGLRVAKYTSPHLIDFRERLLIDGAPVPEAAIVDFVHEWTPVIERIGATFFEATTAMAFALAAREKPDVAIVEVGLGGRLDATNVVDPVLAVVTNIARDHSEYLGDTLEQVAAEKGGIFKPGRPAVIGEPEPRLAGILAEHARNAAASPIHMTRERSVVGAVELDPDGTRFSIRNDGAPPVDLRTALLGRHQAWNAAVALHALAVLPEPWRTPDAVAGRALPAVRLAGRFQISGRYIFDVAHNAAGAAACAATLAELDPTRPRMALLSVLGDKDWRAMMEIFARVVDTFVITTAPTSPAGRMWDPAAAQAEAAARGWSAHLEPDFDSALARAAEHAGTILVTGSFHTVGDAMARLHVSPLAG